MRRRLLPRRPRPSSRPYLEELEPRILYSADLAPTAEQVEAVEQVVEEEPAEAVEADASFILTEEELQSSTDEQTALVINESNVTNTQVTEETKRELVIVNGNLEDSPDLINALKSSNPDFDLLVLNSDAEPFSAIHASLAEIGPVDTIHILSHGDDGGFELGNLWISDANLQQFQDPFSALSAFLTDGADILLYGCEIAESETGESFVSTLAQWTGADIAASSDITGHESLGGDWDLEYERGRIDSDSITAAAVSDWEQSLATVAYEGFDYADGTSISNQTGGTGWADGWSDVGTNHTVSSTGLQTQNDDLITSGGSLQIFSSGSGSVDIVRNVTTTLGADGTTVWVSFLITPDKTGLFDWAGVSFGDPSGNQYWVGQTYNRFAINKKDGIEPVYVSGATAEAGTSYLLTAKIDFTSGNDTVTLYVEPQSGYDETTAIASATKSNRDIGTFTEFVIETGSSTNQAVIDELRVGTTFTDVTPASEITVNTATDELDGDTSSIDALIATPGGTGISLREAITAANNTSITDIIKFDISGSSTITLASALPDITDGVIVDGTTDPDYAGTPVIIVDGNSSVTSVLTLAAGSDGSEISGLSLTGSTDAGLVIQSDNNTVQANDVSNNDAVGIRVFGNDNLIGGTDTADANTVSNNGTHGIRVPNDLVYTGNAFLGNLIFNNGKLAIDLKDAGDNADWLTANDSDDSDTGANNLQNFPVISNVLTTGSEALLTGSLTSTASTDYRIEFFASATEDPTGYGEAERYLGAISITTDASGYVDFSTVLASTVIAGEFVSATATVDLGSGNYGDTSELSKNFTAVAALLSNSPEQLVHTADLANVQETSSADRGAHQAVAMDNFGNYVVVWSDAARDGDGWGVFAQRYDLNGAAVGDVIQVNNTSTAGQLWANVAMDDAGNFVIVWTSDTQDGDGYGIYARGFNSDGSQSFAEQRINKTTSGSQQSPTISMAGDGRFVVVWEGEGSSDTDGIYFRRFDADGSYRDWNEQLANASDLGAETNAVVSMNDAGDFSISWMVGGNIYLRPFLDDGSAIRAASQINVYAIESPAAIALDNSGLVSIVWRGLATAIHDGIWMQVYDTADGSLLGSSIQVDQNGVEDSTNPSIAIDASGNRIVVYEGSGDGDGTGVFARIIDSGNTPVGNEFQINETATGTQHMASVAMLDTSNYVVVWSGNGVDDDSGVFRRQYGTGQIPVAVNDNYAVTQDTPLTVNAASGLLANDWDPQSDALSAAIIAGPDNGTLTLASPTIISETTLVDGSTNAVSGLVWSPDGSQIAYTQLTGGYRQVFVMNSDGSGSATQLTFDGGSGYYGRQPSWSPDGTQLAITSNRYGDDDIIIIDATDGTEVLQLTDNSITDHTPSWSPDGSKIAYSAEFGGGYEIYIVNSADGSGSTRLTLLGGVSRDPVWSPDGSQIVFRGGTSGGDLDIYTMDASDGTGLTILTTSAENDLWPHVSPDGSKILFTSDRTEPGVNQDLWIMDADGSNETQLAETTSNDLSPRWSPDSNQIAYLSDDSLVIATLGYDGSFTYTPDTGFTGTDTVTYIVNDGSETSSVATVTFSVTAVNAPTDIAPNSFSVDENVDTSGGYSLGALSATDPDVGETFTWSIVAGDDGALFSIGGASSDELILTDGVLDYENKNSYTVTVRVTDSTLKTYDETLTVSVNDVNDAPVITSDGGGTTATVNVAENQLAVTTVTATDEDLPADALTYSISGGADQALFSINASSGQLDFLLPADFENPSDANTDNIYEVEVTADDGNGGTTAQLISVTVTDVASVAQQALMLSTEKDVTSGPDIGAWSSGAIVQLSDPNLALEPGTTAGTFSSSVDFDSFAALNGDGDTRVGSLHYVSQTVTIAGSYALQAGDIVFSVRDSETFTDSDSVTTLSVTKSDVIVFRPDDLANYAAGGTFDLLLEDAIGAEVRALSLVETDTWVGDALLPAGTFLIASAGGSIDSDIYHITPSSVGVGSTIAETAPGTMLIDGADAAITSKIMGLELVEQDTDLGGTSLQAGNILVTLDGSDTPGSNAVSVTEYDVFVLDVSTTGSGTTAATASLLLEGADVALDTATASPFSLALVPGNNQAPTITSDGGGNTAAINVAENTTAVTTVTATDPDLDTLTYSIVGGADASQFTIDANSGALSFNAAKNFESPADANADNVYEVLVTVSDGNGGTDSQSLLVSSTDANEAPTAITLSNNTVQEHLDTTSGLSFGTLSTTDVDAIDTAAYSVVGGADAAKFSIGGGSSDELIISDGILNYGRQSSYEVIVRVMDSGGATHDETLTINVTDLSNLLLHLEFEDGAGTTATDSSIYGNNATLTGEADWTSGAIGGAFHFDYSSGSEDFFEVPDSPSLQNVQESDFYTLAAWFKADDVPAGTMAQNNDWAYGIVVKEGEHTGLWYAADQHFKFETLLDTGYLTLESTGTYEPGVFHHIAVTFDRPAGLVSLYIDGNLDNTASFTPNTATYEYGTETWKVGTAQGTFATDDYAYPSKSSIDDVRIYEEALSGAAVTSLYGLATDNAPVFTSSGPYSIDENPAASAVIGDIDANDGNSGDADAGITYSIITNANPDGDGSDAVSIDSASGVISVNDTTDFDFENLSSFIITVQADDGVNQSNTDITINLNNVNEGTTGSVTIDNANPVEGNTLTAANTLSDWDGLSGPVTYQWRVDGVDIPGATGTTYTTTSADVGKQISVTASYVDLLLFPVSVNSADTAAVAANQIPVAVDDSYSVSQDTSLVIDATGGLLANDSDPENDSLSVLYYEDPAHGTLTLNPDGSFTYTPDAGYVGSDTFTYVAEDNRVALDHEWRLGGDAVDQIGAADGTISGTTQVAGAMGDALDFTPGDYVALPDVSYNDEFSVNFWFNLDSNVGSGYGYMYSHGDAAMQNSLSVLFAETSTGSNPNSLRTVFNDSNDTNDYYALDIDVATHNLADSQWHQYTLTVSKTGGANVYIDGVLLASQTNGGDSFDPTGTLYLGTRNDFSSIRYYDGALDNVQIYGRELSAAEVLANFDGGSASGTVSITVNATNTAPTALPVSDINVLKNSSPGSIDLTQIFSDAEQSSADLVYSLTNTNPTLVNASIDNTTDRLNLAIAPDSLGVATITLRATDAQGAFAEASFVMTVLDAEGLTQTIPISPSGTEDSPLIFSAGTSNEVSVSVGTTGNDLVRVSLAVTDGVLNLASTSGVTVESGADGSATMTLVGLETDLNAAFDGLIFTPALNFNGSATLQINSDLASSMQAHFSFDNPADLGSNDSPYGSTDAVNNGTTAATDADRGAVAYFDGSSYLAVADDFGQPTDVTLAAWVNLDAGKFNSDVISIGNDIVLRLDDAVGSAGVSGFYREPGGSWNSTVSNAFINGTGWHHVAYSIDSLTNLQTLYIDGLPVTTTNYTDAINFAGSQTTIGSHSNASSYFMLGSIDDARIYDRVLTDEEITALAVNQASVSNHVNVAVTAVNDIPTSAGIADVAELEDSADTVIDLATVFDDIEDTDPDLSYVVLSNSNSALFTSTTIDDVSGTLTLSYAPDQSGSANLVVRATDTEGGTVDAAFTVTVSAQNDAPVMTSPVSQNVLEGESVVMTLTATDVDSVPAALSYSITGGADQALFNLSAAGLLQFVTTPDFEAMDDANGDGIYELEVTVTDDLGASDVFTLSITLDNVYEAPVFTSLQTADVYTEDTELSLADIRVNHPDNRIVTLTLTLQDPSAGTIQNGPQPQAKVSPSNAAVWTMTGTAEDMNLATADLYFVPAENAFGTVTVDILLDDGISQINTQKVLTGIPVADSPEVGSTSSTLGGSSSPIPILPHPDDGAEVSHFRIANITNGYLTLADGATLISEGQFITLAEAAEGLIFTATVASTGSFTAESSEDGITVSPQSAPVTATIDVQSAAISETPEKGGDTDPSPSEPTKIELEEQENDAPINTIHFIPEQAEDLGNQTSANDDNEANSALVMARLEHSEGNKGNDNDEDGGVRINDVKTQRYSNPITPLLVEIMSSNHELQRLELLDTSLEQMVGALGQMDEELAKFLSDQPGIVTSTVTVATGLSVGYVVWMFRGGMLLSSLLFSLPAWQVADPLPVLNANRKSRDEDDESLESMIEKRSKERKRDRQTESLQSKWQEAEA